MTDEKSPEEVLASAIKKFFTVSENLRNETDRLKKFQLQLDHDNLLCYIQEKLGLK